MARSSTFMPFFHDWVEAFVELSGDQCKELLLAMVQYHKDGTEPPPFNGSARIAAAFLFPALRRSKQCAAAGKKGGLATASSVASTAASSKSQANVNHKDKDKNKDENEDIDENKDKTRSRFDEFWMCYPKKVGKATAQKAWEKLSPDDALCDTILSAVEEQKRSPQWCKDGGQFIPNPSTWLNQRRWEDELTLSASEPANGSFDTDEFYEAALAASLRAHGFLLEEGEESG